MLYLLQRGLPKCFNARYLGKFRGQSLQGIYFRRVNDCTELYTLKHTGSYKQQNSQDLKILSCRFLCHYLNLLGGLHLILTLTLHSNNYYYSCHFADENMPV